MKANDLSNFCFTKVSAGCYRVTYTTPKRGDYWAAMVNDMTIIDATKNAEYAKAADIAHLRDVVKANGVHYSAYGEEI